MAGIKEGQGQLIFGLDIGTRSIVGTVGYLNNGKFHVLAQRSKEHETRAMLDGQIHDIGQVGETISQVRTQLEEDLNRELTDVCIAAAGRVLRTVTTYVEHEFDTDKEVTEEDVNALSTVGVEKAYEEFQGINDTDMKFYCVGYTPMRYYMNGYPIGNPVGHKAHVIGIDLIATFLPDDVVDGLYKAVEAAGLRVLNVTLEPIAAIQVAIPEKFRMLNMALVDVGAGTSDISITKDGTITAYGMIPVAGDCLTDILVQHCLVEFDTAEQIKRKSAMQDTIEYLDIMGLPQTITAKEVEELLHDSVADMARQVADCIRELNGEKPVSAVFVVGGGGMISGYTELLAEELGIVKERVAVRGQEVMRDIVFEMEDARKDAMMVTPIGICLSYYEQSNNFIFVKFNGERMKLYDNGRLTVADAAMQAMFPNEDLFPKRGQALTFTVNGKARMVRGLQGEASVILINEGAADIYTQVHNGDRVEVVPSTMGEAAAQELGALSELGDCLHVYVNGRKIDLPKTASVNGNRETEYYQIHEGDQIIIHNYYTVQEVAEFLDMPLGGNICVNDTMARADTRVYENFTVSWDDGKEESYGAGDNTELWGDETQDGPERENLERENLEPDTSEALLDTGEQNAPDGRKAERKAVGQAGQEPNALEQKDLQHTPEGANADQDVSGQTDDPADAPQETVTAQSPEEAPGTPQKQGTAITVTANGQRVTMSGKQQFVYVDIFDYISFDLKASNGRAIATMLNGRPAKYMEPLKNGDVIEIFWK